MRKTTKKIVLIIVKVPGVSSVQSSDVRMSPWTLFWNINGETDWQFCIDSSFVRGVNAEIFFFHFMAFQLWSCIWWIGCIIKYETVFVWPWNFGLFVWVHKFYTCVSERELVFPYSVLQCFPTDCWNCHKCVLAFKECLSVITIIRLYWCLVVNIETLSLEL